MARSFYGLPIVFFNLSGEMLFILAQRLAAQNILPDKANKVMCDIVSQMVEDKCLQEIFNPRPLYSKEGIRSVFDRLAHASIMRLNTSSMDKLYDLMAMAFKYQAVLCKSPEDLLLVTFNHLDAIRELVSSSATLMASVNDIYCRLKEHYKDMSVGDFQYIRHSILYFFQGYHKKVSVLLKEKAQLQDGHFVLSSSGPVTNGAGVPGTIQYYQNNVVVRSDVFVPALAFTASEKRGSLDLHGDRITTLGTNLYVIRKQQDPVVESIPSRYVPPPDIGGDPVAKHGFNLLAELIGTRTPSSSDTFKLNLFNGNEEEEYSSPTRPSVVNIDAKKSDAHLKQVIEDFSSAVTTEEQNDDILDLLDQAVS